MRLVPMVHSHGAKGRERGEMAFPTPAVLAILILAALVGSILLGSAFRAMKHGPAADIDHQYKYYTSIEIQEGDTLWHIAQNYAGGEWESSASYINEIKRLNHMKNDQLQSGGYLLIPYYSTEAR